MDLKIKLLLIIFLNGVGNLYAQENLVSYIFDSETKNPVSYVNIGIVNSNTGTVSDDKGRFEIKGNSINDSIIISSIGYETQKVCLKDISEDDVILIDPLEYLIEEIQITSSAFDLEVILGERNENKRGHSFGFGSAQLGTELGTPIKIEKETLIKSVNFALNHAKGDSLLFRINIYNFQDGKVGDNILKENIFFKDKQKPGSYSIDLSVLELILSDDVLLSLEWLRNFDEIGNKSITFDTKKGKSPNGTYIKYSSNSEFKRMPFKKKYKPCIYFIGKQSSN